MLIASNKNNTPDDFEINRKNFGRRLRHWEHLPLLIIVIFTIALHFSFIMKPNTVVGDEYYYIENARSIINGAPTMPTINEYYYGDSSLSILNRAADIIPEHPPLAKLFIIAGIRIFGDNPFGWRFFSVIFGTIAIILLYFICRRLPISRLAAILATFLFALENMFFVHASLGWLDVYMLTFMLAGLLLYLHKVYTLMGIAIALSMLCKLSGGLAILAVCIHWLFAGRSNPKQMIIALLTTALAFLVFMTLFEYFIQGIIIDAVQRTSELFRLTAAHKFTDWFSAVRPWRWLVPHKIFSYSGNSTQYLSFMSWTIQILVIPAVTYMVYKATRGNNAACFGVAWFTATYLTWIPIVLFTDRISFDFYFLPTTGAVCIGIGMALSDVIDKLKVNVIRRGKITTGVKIIYAGIALYLLLHLTVFAIANPALPDHMKQWLGPIIW